MVVVSQTKDQAQGKKTVDKFIFAMSKPKVRILFFFLHVRHSQLAVYICLILFVCVCGHFL